MAKPPIDILRLMTLCGLTGDSWAAWRVVLRALFALRMDDAALATYRALMGRTEPPAGPARELWCACGLSSASRPLAPPEGPTEPSLCPAGPQSIRACSSRP